MEQKSTQRQEIKLIGIQVRTSNHDEQDKMKGKIFPCVQKYFHQAIVKKIPTVSGPAPHIVHTLITKVIVRESTPTS